MDEETQGGCLDPLITSAIGAAGCVTVMVMVLIAAILVLVIGTNLPPL